MSTKNVNPENATEPDDSLELADEQIADRGLIEVGVFADRDRHGTSFQPRRWLPMPDTDGFDGIYGPKLSDSSPNRCLADDVDCSPFATMLEHRVSTQVRDGTHIASVWLDRETGAVVGARASDDDHAPTVSEDDLDKATAALQGDVELPETEGDEPADRAALAAATDELREASEGDKVWVNDRSRALTVTATVDDGGELELEGNGTSYQIELDVEYVPKHWIWAVEASWLDVPSAGRPRIITSATVKDGDS
jgi:hypothetical protein